MVSRISGCPVIVWRGTVEKFRLMCPCTPIFDLKRLPQLQIHLQTTGFFAMPPSYRPPPTPNKYQADYRWSLEPPPNVVTVKAPPERTVFILAVHIHLIRRLPVERYSPPESDHDAR